MLQNLLSAAVMIGLLGLTLGLSVHMAMLANFDPKIAYNYLAYLQ